MQQKPGKYGAVEWATPIDWTKGSATEVAKIVQRVHRDISNVKQRQYSLYVVVWTLQLNPNERINSYLLKKEGSLLKMVQKKKSETVNLSKMLYEQYKHIYDYDVEWDETVDWEEPMHEFYCITDGIPVRWGYMPLSDDDDCCSMCADILMSNVTNSFLIALDSELPETVMTDDLLRSIIHPENKHNIHYNYIYENLTPKVYSNDRIVLSFGRPDDLTVCLNGICSSPVIEFVQSCLFEKQECGNVIVDHSGGDQFSNDLP